MINRACRLYATAFTAPLVILTAMGAAAAPAAKPRESGRQPAAAPRISETRQIDVTLGRSAVVDLSRPIGSIINPNPKLLVTELVSRRQLVVFGQSEGTGELRLIDQAGVEFQKLEISVNSDLAPLQGLIDTAVGAKGIRVKHVGAMLVLEGETRNSGQAALAMDIAQKSGAPNVPIVNLIKVLDSDQVTFAVRVLEVKTSKLKSLGFKWNAMQAASAGATQLGNVFDGGVLARPGDQFSLAASSTFKIGRSTVDAFVDFLRTEGQGRLLAEPTIVATAGKPAKFLAGGEFPVPVPYAFGGTSAPTNGTVSNTFQGIIYKQYGISLACNATLDAQGRIELHIAPEVSSIDYVNSIEYGGNKVPALATRRAETDLRLASGETIIFAGLTSRASSQNSNRLPIGGSRFLDFLAGPQSESRDETELVIIVTPTLGAHVEAGSEALKPPANTHASAH
jgi:pilus assembly protein CpaC